MNVFNPAEIVFGTDDTGRPVYMIKYNEELVYILEHYNDRYTGDRDIYVGGQGSVFRVVEDKIFVSPDCFKQFLTNHTENLEQPIPYKIILDHWYEVKSFGGGFLKTVANASLELALKDRFKNFSIIRTTPYKTISPFFSFDAPYGFFHMNNKEIQVEEITIEEYLITEKVFGKDSEIAKSISASLLVRAKNKHTDWSEADEP